MQTERSITNLDIATSPRIENRHLNNWETTRLYAGNNASGTGGLNGENGSIFNFAATGPSAGRNLPVILDRYIVVARALASVGINGFEINLVNADNAYLTPAYIAQEAALADALRPYGIRISLAINYTAPTDPRFAPDTLTNDQLDPYGDAFRGWWNRKADELQASIPDFMGFTVKANSEGQPGPQDFGYDHGDGANGIGAAVAPLDMKVYWRTFVYNADVDPDRLKRAYLEFGPIDDEDRFLDNVFLQTKNGPLDFQAREPFHPMFGRMENTNQALELQITQEYTGQSTMLAYLGPMWEEVLKTETHAPGRVGEIVDGTAQNHEETAIVGVANLGNADNLTGHHFSQSNLFAFGRQAWDWKLDSDDMAEDWVRMTWTNDDRAVRTIVEMMMGSWEALVSYQTPLGIGHQFRSSDHYGPKPDEFFIKDDWSPVYYNQADSEGLGYDRSPTGSNFTAQYFPTLERRYGDIETVPENLMMWFHHVPWDHRMDNGRVFWDELVLRYQTGVQYVTWMRETWDALEGDIDARRFAEVRAKLAAHEADAADWRDTSVGYWQEFSGRPIPVDGPLAAEIVVAGQRFGGFDASAASYTIPVPAGASPRITRCAPLAARGTASCSRPMGCLARRSSRSAGRASSGRSSRTTCSRSRRGEPRSPGRRPRSTAARRTTRRGSRRGLGLGGAAQREGEYVGVVPLAGAVAVWASTQSAARMPGTLLAAIEAPVPVQQATTAWSARPSATSRAAASDAQAQSSRSSELSAPCSSGSWPRERSWSTSGRATPVSSSAAMAILIAAYRSRRRPASRS